MTNIIKVTHIQNKNTYALVNVNLSDGTEAVCFVGGEVEVFFHHGIIKAFVKKTPTKETP